MAGIIAQLTRAARDRRDRRTYGTNKCMYTLEPFDTNGFDATVHNKYCVQKAMWEERVKSIQEEEEEIVNAWREYKVVRIVNFMEDHLIKLSETKENAKGSKIEFS